MSCPVIAPTFSAIVEDSGPPPIVALAGELDVATAPALADCLESLLAGGGRSILLDMSRLSFMDCAGISALVRAREHGATLLLRGCRGEPARVLAWEASKRLPVGQLLV